MKNKSVLFWLVNRIRRRLPGLLLMTAAAAGQSLLGVAFALGTKKIIDCAVAGEQAAFYEACWQQGLIVAAILLCLALSRHLKDRLAADLEWDWKRQLFHGVLGGDYSAVSAYHSGELLSRMNADVQVINDGVLTILPGLVSMATKLVAAVAVLAVLDGKFTLLILSLGAVFVLVTALLRRKLKDLHKQIRDKDGKISAFLQEMTEKLLIVQAMDLSEEVEKRSENLLKQRHTIQLKRKNISLTANMGISLLSYSAAFFALLWCAFRVLAGAMSFGSLTAVTQLVSQLQTPFVGISGVMPRYVALIGSAERLMELDFVWNPVRWERKDSQALYQKMTELRAEKLSFSYGEEAVFRDAAFSVPKGSFAVIEGASGIGKSTLLKLLLGIYAPDSGELAVCLGEEKVPLDRTTRSLFAYVPQGNLLFSGSLRENLLLSRPDASEAELLEAMRISCLDTVTANLPEGLDTQLGENGYGLSEGQAQRLSIARAVLSGAPILLLDEATSALDPQTEALVLQRLKTLENRTCIAVTHRPAASELADWKLQLDQKTVDCRKNG